MAFLQLLEEGHFFEIQRSIRQREDLEEQAVAYAGSLRPHYNPNMVLLLNHPLDNSSEIYEFRFEDILCAEEMPSISRPNGVTIEQKCLWVRHGSPAMRMQPLRVGESSEDQKGSKP